MSLDSRPETPDSPSSLRNATATIDDLTLALSDFSRAHSPEPPNVSTCCCGREDCETTQAWCAFKAKLESRLVLSAEVGQALLERHEAYVRRHELARQVTDRTSSAMKTWEGLNSQRTEEQVDARVADLVRENAVLEKELKQAKETISRLSAQHARLVGLDQRFTAAIQEKDDVQQERDSAVQRARLAETRLISLKEKCCQCEDLALMTSVDVFIAKLQAQVNRLREDLDMQRSHRQELSEEILSDARERLQQLQQVQLGHASMVDETEITKVLESLVADNEALKHDYAEVQNLLAETREDLRALQEEIDERRANDPTLSRHRHTSNVASVGHTDASTSLSANFTVGTAPTPSIMHSNFRNARAGPSHDRRAASMERSPHRVFEPLTPETGLRSLSPARSYLTTDAKNTSFSRPRSPYAPSQLSFEADDDSLRETRPIPPEKPRGNKSLSLLTRSQGVQTDGTGSSNNILGLSAIPRGLGDLLPSSSPRDGLSESSSITDGQTSVIGALIDRLSTLMNRLIQADALTLTNRLKRQHLLGADVSHLSRSTVSSILQEVNTLRLQYRAFLEDEKITTTCTRKDLRGLFKLFKDMFSELGQLRVTLNDVILDPAVAGKVSDMALHPSKSEANPSNTGSGDAVTGSSGWIAPLSKLLGLPGGSSNPEQDAATRALSPPARPSSRGRGRPPPRIVLKREPALSASAMTVNVEFSGAGVGRAVTSTYSADHDRFHPVPSQPQTTQLSPLSGVTNQTLRSSASRSVMNIFAGAPRPTADSGDPWIVVPKAQRATQRSPDVNGSATIGRSGVRNLTVDGSMTLQAGSRHPSANKRLSRIVDAVIDRDPSQQGFSPTRGHDTDEDDPTSEGRDLVQDTLLERTLRPRGLSDSSIHTTFMAHGERDEAQRQPQSSTVTRQSVLQALSRKVQSFRSASTSLASSIPVSSQVSATIAAVVSRPHTPQAPPVSTNDPDTSVHPSLPVPMPGAHNRAISPGGARLFAGMNLAGWAATAATLENESTPSAAGLPPFYGSPRDERLSTRGWTREREL
ncbi:unnamed protein product [Somion occarium]|uniref:Uncharacterized protein n=1 Tax=Somion occarium TaxID=3059160 RepID=A0ABP1CWP3_9APHY